MTIDQELFNKIEHRYGIRLPDAYVDMMNKGWLCWNNEKRPYLLSKEEKNPDSPLFYLWFFDMEWLPLQEIVDFEYPEYQFDRFVPFSHTGGGDNWSWDPKGVGEHGLSVVDLPHDDENGRVYANNFIGALYRHALDFAKDCYEEAKSRQSLALWRRCFTPYFPKGWIEQLGKLQTARYVARGQDSGSLLDDKNYREILVTDLKLPEKDIKFRWHKPRA